MVFSRVLRLIFLLVIACFVKNTLGQSLNESIQSLELEPIPIQSKIIGGSKTQPGSYPYMVSLRAPAGTMFEGKDIEGQHYCGGALIAKNIVLTAGHCLKSFGFVNVDVDIGRFNREGDDEGRFQAFHTRDTRVHPNFDQNGGWLNFDVALLVLDGESQADTIDFVRSEEELGFQRGVVLGWGNTVDVETTSPSEILLQATVPLVQRDECRTIFQGAALITDQMTCAGEKGTDACVFDSGGPLLVNQKVAGIVSWGIDCGEEKPGVYASVGALAGWIDDQIRDINNLPPDGDGDNGDQNNNGGTGSTGGTDGPGCIYVGGIWLPPGCNK